MLLLQTFLVFLNDIGKFFEKGSRNTKNTFVKARQISNTTDFMKLLVLFVNIRLISVIYFQSRKSKFLNLIKL